VGFQEYSKKQGKDRNFLGGILLEEEDGDVMNSPKQRLSSWTESVLRFCGFFSLLT